MSKSNKGEIGSKEKKTSLSSEEAEKVNPSPQKGPLSFLSGAVTSGFLAWICLRLSQAMVTYFTIHTSNYDSAIAQSIASGFKTLVIGMSF